MRILGTFDALPVLGADRRASRTDNAAVRAIWSLAGSVIVHLIAGADANLILTGFATRTSDTAIGAVRSFTSAVIVNLTARAGTN